MSLLISIYITLHCIKEHFFTNVQIMLHFKDTPKAFFLILNNFEFFSIEKAECLSFYMHIKFLQNLQRFGKYLI